MTHEHEAHAKTVWDQLHITTSTDGDDLNAAGWWAQEWMPFLANTPHGTTILDLGCGTGGDALSLAQSGYSIIGLDYSHSAVLRAKHKTQNLPSSFLVSDLTAPLPFASSSFEIVMSNVALHMFSDAVTRSIFQEIHRITQPGGLLLFHVNSIEQLPHREIKPVQQLAPDFYLDETGSTMHFFDEAYCRDLLSDWRILHLQHLERRLKLFANREPITKCVWQAVAQK